MCEICSSWSKISCAAIFADSMQSQNLHFVINGTHPVTQRKCSICHLALTWSFRYIHIKRGSMICTSVFLDAIASPSTYPCQWVGDSFRFGDSYRISELCELVTNSCFEPSMVSIWKTIQSKWAGCWFTQWQNHDLGSSAELDVVTAGNCIWATNHQQQP